MKFLKMFSPNQIGGIVKIDDKMRTIIVSELNTNPKFLLLLLDNLRVLIDIIDDEMLECNKSSIDYGIAMAILVGQKKAYKQLINLLTEQK